MDEFAHEVKKRLDELGMTYAKLSAKTGVSRQYLYRVLDHGDNCSMKVADQIATAIGLKIVIEK